MISRRRFIALTASAMASPAAARMAPLRWRGFALGAEVSLTLHAEPGAAAAAIQTARQVLETGEALFSLYRPDSRLSQLNKARQLDHPEPLFLELMQTADQVHQVTQGRFDPTVQPLWQALAQGVDSAPARKAIGWRRVRFSDQRVTLAQGQSLTFNGIAQGVITDLLRQRWQAMGLDKALINIGEFAALGGPFTLGVSDPAYGLVAQERLTDLAVATSSPGSMSLGPDTAHIIGPAGEPTRWSTVSVVAKTAAIADAASTAFCLMSRDEIEAARERLPTVKSVVLVGRNGHIVRL